MEVCCCPVSLKDLIGFDCLGVLGVGEFVSGCYVLPGLSPCFECCPGVLEG
jgi:hypothetical protein